MLAGTHMAGADVRQVLCMRKLVKCTLTGFHCKCGRDVLEARGTGVWKMDVGSNRRSS